MPKRLLQQQLKVIPALSFCHYSAISFKLTLAFLWWTSTSRELKAGCQSGEKLQLLKLGVAATVVIFLCNVQPSTLATHVWPVSGLIVHKRSLAAAGLWSCHHVYWSVCEINGRLPWYLRTFLSVLPFPSSNLSSTTLSNTSFVFLPPCRRSFILNGPGSCSDRTTHGVQFDPTPIVKLDTSRTASYAGYCFSNGR
ncbi:conserved hypothetical protein [Ricinus communis]|uniref:Uncharacterized protein n=1 Tax=Ricinus communis TaxID=3988 RepID=B9TFU0_RICCO|nr:conserved hypothetical protein [Ricinus communis]